MRWLGVVHVGMQHRWLSDVRGWRLVGRTDLLLSRVDDTYYEFIEGWLYSQ